MQFAEISWWGWVWHSYLLWELGGVAVAAALLAVVALPFALMSGGPRTQRALGWLYRLTRRCL